MSQSNMSDGIITNVRLVKCPKCSRVLTEFVDVPVYRCGSCGVVLQAKNRKTKIEDTKAVPSELPLPQDQLGNTSDYKDSGSPTQNGNHLPAEGNSRDKNNNFQENISADCVTETEGGNVPNECCVDNEILAYDDGNSGPNEQQDSACDLKGPRKGEDHIARSRKLYVGTDPTGISSFPVKQTSYGLHHHTVDSTSYFSGLDSEKLPFNQENALTVESQSVEEAQGSQKNRFHEIGPNYGSADELLIKRKRRPIVAAGNTHLTNASLPIEEVYGGSESVNERASTFSSPVSEELQSFGAKSSSPNEDDFTYESSYSDVIQSLPIKKTEHSQTSSPNVYDSENRANELEVPAAAFPSTSSSKLSGTLGKISKSATTRCGHGYDGSISSYEDQYDQIYKQTFRDVNYVENDAKRNFSASQVSGITAVQQQAQEFFRSEKNHKTIQESSWSQPIESDELMRHQIRHQMPLEAEMYPSETPLTTRGYENDGFTSDCWDGIRGDSNIYSADRLPYTERKRIELLKMVHELQEELSRSPASQGNVGRKNISQFENIAQFSKGRQMPVHRTRKEFVDEADLQSKYSRYPFTRSQQGTNWHRHQNHSWMPFSGEVKNDRHHDEYYCQHHQHVDQRFSAQLAPSVCSVCSLNAGLQRVHLHPGDQFRNPYSSSTSSPQRCAESDFPSRVGNMNYDNRRLMESDFPSSVHDVTYSDKRLMDRYAEASRANSGIATDYVLKDEMKIIRAREKQLRVKRHIRPIAGGAPFVTCYQCWSTLQLPADSFLFKRRLHKLKCESCSKIVKFSVEDRTHIVPYVHDNGDPPSSEGKGRSPVISPAPSVNTSSNSHGIQMSRPDHEFGNSFGRSFSATEQKKEFFAATTHAAQISGASGKKLSSGGSSDIVEGKKKRFSKPFFSKDKRPIESPETSSTNRTFKIEEPRTGSPLHRLMGYTSISQVFRGSSKGSSESFRNKSTR